MYVPKNRTSKYLKPELIQLERPIHRCTITVTVLTVRTGKKQVRNARIQNSEVVHCHGFNVYSLFYTLTIL